MSLTLASAARHHAKIDIFKRYPKEKLLAIVRDKESGMKLKEICKKHSIGASSVNRIWYRFKNNSEENCCGNPI